jgi:hypothetical protein
VRGLAQLLEDQSRNSRRAVSDFTIESGLNGKEPFFAEDVKSIPGAEERLITNAFELVLSCPLPEFTPFQASAPSSTISTSAYTSGSSVKYAHPSRPRFSDRITGFPIALLISAGVIWEQRSGEAELAEAAGVLPSDRPASVGAWSHAGRSSVAAIKSAPK